MTLRLERAPSDSFTLGKAERAAKGERFIKGHQAIHIQSQGDATNTANLVNLGLGNSAKNTKARKSSIQSQLSLANPNITHFAQASASPRQPRPPPNLTSGSTGAGIDSLSRNQPRQNNT